MASYISSSEEIIHQKPPALPSGLRLTAADRPGMAQPVPERNIPQQPWRPMAITVTILLLLFTSLWEWKMRTLELVLGDLGRSTDRWAELRREIDQRNVPVVIVGDSRILYDSDLDRATQLIGVRPVQLAIPGASGLPILMDLADDPHFKGVAIVGMMESTYFDLTGSREKKAIDLARWESPSKRGSFFIQRVLSHGLAMLDEDYKLSTLIFRLDSVWRRGVKGPRQGIWKPQETGPGGQVWLWRRVEHDRSMSEHIRYIWVHYEVPPEPLDDQTIRNVSLGTKVAVAKIRARGGDVVFVRPPSDPDVRAVEDRHIPRARGWDELLATTHSNGVHFDDLPAAQNLTLPEGGHTTRACAAVFTDAYLRALIGKTPLLHLQPDAPSALSTPDCVQQSLTKLP
jgi:hypothetical protein